MAGERSAKRRKLNSSSTTTAIESPTHTEAVQHQAKAGTTKRLEQSIAAADADGAGDDVNIRVSGRARRLPAKLAEDTIALAPRQSNTVSRSKSRTPASTEKVESRRKKVSLSDHDVIPTNTKAKSRRNVSIGKENLTPPSTVAIVQAGSESPDSAVTSEIAQAPLSKSHAKSSAQKQYSQASQPPPAAKEEDDEEVLVARQDELMIPSAGLHTIREAVLSRATGKDTIPQIDRKDEYTKVSALVKQAVEHGESNSMLLIGSRGTGKSALINQVVRTQQQTHPDDFHVVRLNGFIHTDDKLALRDIWRQLGREMELEDKETSVRSYADTLSMLLALLSHPVELGQSTNPGQITKSVIFIMDEFDLFTTHPRQTLLYNLFDIAQSRKAPIAVLGLTTRVDVVEALEKRVKSRFSHRYVHLGPARSLASFTTICKAHLEAPEDVPSKTVTAWNAAVETLFTNEHFALHIRKIYYRSKSIQDFLTTMLMPFGSLPMHDLTTSEFVEHCLSSTSMSSLGPDSKLDLLSSLSTLQMALLICAARQTAIYATENVSFNLAYEEYKAIAGKAKLQATASGALSAGARVWGKDVAKNAWADIVNIGLIMQDGRGVGKVDIALEEIAESGVELGQWTRWCKEI